MHELRRFALLLGLLAAAQVTLAQLDTVWSRQIVSGGNSVNLRGIAVLAGGDIAVCGFQTDQANNEDMFAARLTSDGSTMWMRSYGNASLNEESNALVELANGSLIVVGYNRPISSSAVLVWALNAQGDTLWTRSFAGTSPTKGFGICRLPDDNIAVVGYKSTGSTRLWLLKLSPRGDTLWTRTYGQTGATYGYRVAPGADGKLIIAGYRGSSISSPMDFWLLQTDSLGIVLSDTTLINPSIDDVCYGLAISDGDIYLGGRSNISNTDRSVVARIPSNGSTGWAITYDNPNWPQELVRDVAKFPGGGVFCVGWNTLSGTADYYPLAMTVDPTGASQNVHSYNLFGGRLWGVAAVSGSIGYVGAGSLTTGALSNGLVMRFGPSAGISGIVRRTDNRLPIINGRVSAVGQSAYTFTDSQGWYYLHLRDGTYDVVASAPCVSSDTSYHVEVLPDSIAVHNFALGSPRLVIPQTSLNGVVHNHLSASMSCTVSNTGDAVLLVQASTVAIRPPGSWLRVDPPSAAVAAGDSLILRVRVSPDTTDDGAYDYDGFVVVHSNYCLDSLVQIPVFVTVLDAEEPTGGLPVSFALHPAYPNPFNAVTTVVFDVPRRANVRIALYDVLGRDVRHLLDEPLNAGSHHLRFDAGDLPSGLYVLRMSAGDFMAAQKLVLLK